MSFIRINSAIKNTIENKKNFSKLKFKNAPMHEHAEDTHLLNLDISEDELLKNIKKKDRYYINRAIKEGVKIRIDNEIDHIQTLINMHHKHAIRDN
jgi:lipid II:glycine glycyltransferase (peptidoglycan interpeptide bridge formation enzyme)